MPILDRIKANKILVLILLVAVWVRLPITLYMGDQVTTDGSCWPGAN